ncbi:hypothetical protein [Allomuricauda sp. M10]|uniref:hypothetical protein n=1 Tax=Allomuricauda sp. M10 TaxID=2683292 RepID=UPI001D1924D8|nr:hypothetical protein [Muricauda sp. M10]
MYASKNNLKFEYLYRDAGNYKQFGELVFSNPNNLSAEEADLKLRAKLIDKEYFYPSQVGVPKFDQSDFEFDSEWYEFSRFSLTNQNLTESISIETFISNF